MTIPGMEYMKASVFGALYTTWFRKKANSAAE